jgi:hypothetical protein
MDQYPLIVHVDMKYEQNRFNSFIRSGISGSLEKFKAYASAGFRVLGGDIMCYCCQLPLIPNHFDESDVSGHHRMKASACPFVLGNADNVSMNQVSLFFQVFLF